MAKYKFQQLTPTPARGKFDLKLFKANGWWAEEKFDGDRRIAQFVGGMVRFTGRRLAKETGLFVEKSYNVPHLSKAWGAVVRLPSDPYFDGYPPELEGCVLDGEIVCPWPGARSKDVTSIMGSLPEKAVQKQRERGWVEYRVFDCLFFKGKDKRGDALTVRRTCLETVLRSWKNPFAIAAKMVEPSEANAYLHTIWKAGGEGIILKDASSKYADEKGWVKVKKEQTADVVIMGYADAKKESTKVTGEVSQTKYAKRGWIGAVVFGQYQPQTTVSTDVKELLDETREGVEVKFNEDTWVRYGRECLKLIECGQCSGMDDDMRKEFSKRGDKYLDMVMEISFQEREPSGRFRHPRMTRLRPDKNAVDCKWGVT